MLKKIFVVIISLTCVFAMAITNSAPVFNAYSNKLEVCLKKASSSSQIMQVNNKQFYFLNRVAGESFNVDGKNFNLKKFLKEFNAKIVVVENLENGVSYYAFSPMLKYKSKVLGKTVNLQIFVGERVTVGSPFIFGSF